MATTRTSKTHWEGSLMEGAGQVTLESSGIGTYDVSWPAAPRQPNGKTSPEELSRPRTRPATRWRSRNGARPGRHAAAGRSTPRPTSSSQPGTGITGIHLTVVGRCRGHQRRRLRRGRRGRQAELPRLARRWPARRSRWTPRWPDRAPSTTPWKVPARCRETGGH